MTMSCASSILKQTLVMHFSFAFALRVFFALQVIKTPIRHLGEVAVSNSIQYFATRLCLVAKTNLVRKSCHFVLVSKATIL